MKPTRQSARGSQQPIAPQEALQILFSAVLYIMQAGMRIHAGNVGGKLVLTVTGAQVIYGEGTARFDVTDSVTDCSIPKVTEQVTAQATG